MTDAEYRREKRGIAVPFFFKRKIFMVLMMLVCSGIMAVTATYAWFILSTAPEVVGVTTTVGANGSLEIALLNNETGPDTSKITADVGQSISIVGAVEGNVTWGNLVDVSDASYGLNTIVMYPAILNQANGKLVTNAMLSVPRNGVDGRITGVTSNTMAALFNGSAFSTENANYGVRAIGSVGGGSGREAYLSSAKNSFKASRTSALSTAQNTLASNGTVLISAAAGGTTATYTYNDVTALQSMANGMKNSLNYILTSYKQAIIANAAANTGVDDSTFETIRTGVTAASASALASYANNYPSGMNVQGLNALAASIADAEIAINLANQLLYENYGTDEEKPADPNTVYSYDQVSGIIKKIANTDTITIDPSSLATMTLELSATSGEGLITAVADHAGGYSASIGTGTINVTTTNNEGKGLLEAIDISELKAPAGGSPGAASNTTVTDFYGYVVDLAFRTNVTADLQMQSKAIDRVYADGAGATAGSGTGVIYTAPAGMNTTQINSMLAAVRVVYFDPDTGTIYATGKLDTPNIRAGTEANAPSTATASLVLTSGGEVITDLEAAVPKKVSVLVYLDGTMLNNISVFNGQNSGTLRFNFQFSSSADLNPMVDSELKNASSAEGYGG